jgi:hypothetical protein
MLVAQVEAGVAQQGDVLVSLTQRMQQAERDVRDNEQLVAAVQGRCSSAQPSPAQPNPFPA